MTNSSYISFLAMSPSSRRAWVEMEVEQLAAPTVSVALLAEGVGRNGDYEQPKQLLPKSPSSRRAWVEIRVYCPGPLSLFVALLAEGVGRNPPCYWNRLYIFRSPSSRRAWVEMLEEMRKAVKTASPSSRRAWVEILLYNIFDLTAIVALLAEGVGRNRTYLLDGYYAPRSPSSRRAWVEISKRQSTKTG